ncbi:hypothetical protein UT300005_33400 [Clostridium sp. CTA-5]
MQLKIHLFKFIFVTGTYINKLFIKNIAIFKNINIYLEYRLNLNNENYIVYHKL